MIFRKLGIHNNILQKSESTVGNVLYDGHAAFQRPFPKIREPNTTWYKSLASRFAIAGMSFGVY